jgi:hypothetical protein
VLLEVLGGSCNSGNDYGSSYNSCNSYRVMVMLMTTLMVIVFRLMLFSSNLCSILLYRLRVYGVLKRSVLCFVLVLVR